MFRTSRFLSSASTSWVFSIEFRVVLTVPHFEHEFRFRIFDHVPPSAFHEKKIPPSPDLGKNIAKNEHQHCSAFRISHCFPVPHPHSACFQLNSAFSECSALRTFEHEFSFRVIEIQCLFRVS